MKTLGTFSYSLLHITRNAELVTVEWARVVIVGNTSRAITVKHWQTNLFCAVISLLHYYLRQLHCHKDVCFLFFFHFYWLLLAIIVTAYAYFMFSFCNFTCYFVRSLYTHLCATGDSNAFRILQLVPGTVQVTISLQSSYCSTKCTKAGGITHACVK